MSQEFTGKLINFVLISDLIAEELLHSIVIQFKMSNLLISIIMCLFGYFKTYYSHVSFINPFFQKLYILVNRRHLLGNGLLLFFKA